MKKIQFLFGIAFLLCILQQANAQLLHNTTGYYIDYGSKNNTGTGYWYGYSSVSNHDTVFVESESNDGLVFQGVNSFVYSPTGPIPSNNIYNYVGFLQNRNWGANWQGYTIDMSSPENMVMKIRMKSTGSLKPQKIYIKLMDTLGNVTLNGTSYFTIDPTGTYEDYYFNFSNSWRDVTKGNDPARIVDSSAISGYDFYVELESPITDLTALKLEIDYIQLGSFVDWSYNTLTGRVFNDNNSDCIFNTSDTPVSQGLITALPGPYYAYTDPNGFYELKVDTINTSYTVTYTPVLMEPGLLQSICPASGALTIPTPTSKSTYCCNDFSQKIKQCSVLKIDINSNRRRRCFTNLTYVNYQNDGNVSSQIAEIKVIYPEYVKPISSTPAWTRKNGDTLYYSIGIIAPSSGGAITIVDSVVCWIEEIRSLTQCTKAIISPGTECLYIPAGWNNADVTVKGICTNGVAKFKIQNEGTGDMSDSTGYRVFANDTLISNHKFALKSSEYFSIELPTYGKVIRLEADQVANHPNYNTIPRLAFEGCVASPTLLKNAFKGIAMNVPQNIDLVTAISCMQITDSYDPNDKAVFPKGVSDENFISAGTKLDYKIRFENTGTDDAYTVVVVDTLDADLDASTFIAGNASHSYSIQRMVIDGKEIVKFRFANIYLTPKKIDSIKSQGFVTFSIVAKPSLADGVLIENVASIFFDYNSAIVTNIVSQTIGEYIKEDLSQGSDILRTAVTSVTTGLTGQAKTNSVSIYPNPTNENITIKFLAGASTTARINIYSMSGMLVLSQEIVTTNESVISLQQFPQGIYYYKITDSTGLNQNGKIVKQ